MSKGVKTPRSLLGEIGPLNGDREEKTWTIYNITFLLTVKFTPIVRNLQADDNEGVKMDPCLTCTGHRWQPCGCRHTWPLTLTGLIWDWGYSLSSLISMNDNIKHDSIQWKLNIKRSDITNYFLWSQWICVVLLLFMDSASITNKISWSQGPRLYRVSTVLKHLVYNHLTPDCVRLLLEKVNGKIMLIVIYSFQILPEFFSLIKFWCNRPKIYNQRSLFTSSMSLKCLELIIS